MFFVWSIVCFPVVGASPPGFARPPNLNFGLPEFGWYHFAAAPYCAIYMRESVEAIYMWPFANGRRSFVFVNCVRSILCTVTLSLTHRTPSVRDARPVREQFVRVRS